MDWLELAKTLGFPAIMCLYLCIRFEKAIDRNTQAVADVSKSFMDYLVKREGQL